MQRSDTCSVASVACYWPSASSPAGAAHAKSPSTRSADRSCGPGSRWPKRSSCSIRKTGNGAADRPHRRVRPLPGHDPPTRRRSPGRSVPGDDRVSRPGPGGRRVGPPRSESAPGPLRPAGDIGIALRSHRRHEHVAGLEPGTALRRRGSPPRIVTRGKVGVQPRPIGCRPGSRCGTACWQAVLRCQTTRLPSKPCHTRGGSLPAWQSVGTACWQAVLRCQTTRLTSKPCHTRRMVVCRPGNRCGTACWQAVLRRQTTRLTSKPCHKRRIPSTPRRTAE